jgi:HK97 gp10 family phage protein
MKFRFEDGDLQNLGEILANPQRIALEIAEAALEVAEPNVPVKTGRLKRSGKVKKTARGAQLVYDAALPGRKPYPSFVYDGTSKMPARPFAKNAIDQLSGQVDVLVQRLLDKG